MAEPLKNIYNKIFFDKFTGALEEVLPSLDKIHFIENILDQTWHEKELKQRMRHITYVLERYLPGTFQHKAASILALIPVLKTHGFKQDNLEFIFLPDFIEVFGLPHYQRSMEVFETLTQFVTCEFAVRPFIIQYPSKMMKQMNIWSNHKHPMVRRLASEGSRPRLPWAMAIPFLKDNPDPILPILENLKNDVSESVRRSVANNLNDISKDHPETVVDISKKWKGKSKEIDTLIKHACRTLLKQGGTEVMELFGFGSIDKTAIVNFSISQSKISIGAYLEFSFTLQNHSNLDVKIRLEYAIYYQKANGSLSKKVYKISERSYPMHSQTNVHRRQHFKVITTRKLHPGKHRISLIINGKELESHDFELLSTH